MDGFSFMEVKNFFKKNVVFYFSIVALFFLSSAVWADIFYQPLHAGFFTGLDVGIFKESNEGTAYTSFGNANLQPQGGELQYATPGFEFTPSGFVGYLFGSQDDLAFSFLINQDSVGNTAIPPTGSVAETTVLPANFDASDYANSALNKFSYKTNMYNLIMGHWFTISNRLQIHPFLGINLSHILFKMKTTYFDIAGNAGVNAIVDQRSMTTGAGPMIGLNGIYGLWKKLSLIWNVDGALLAGENLSSLDATQNNLSISVHQKAKSDVSLFELIEATLGVSCDFAIKKVNTEFVMGYRVSEFLNAVNKHAYPDDFQEGVSLHSQSSTGFVGPFVSWSVIF